MTKETGKWFDAAGISEGLVRIAVGLEDLEDLQSDCLRGLEALTR